MTWNTVWLFSILWNRSLWTRLSLQWNVSVTNDQHLHKFSFYQQLKSPDREKNCHKLCFTVTWFYFVLVLMHLLTHFIFNALITDFSTMLINFLLLIVSSSQMLLNSQIWIYKESVSSCLICDINLHRTPSETDHRVHPGKIWWWKLPGNVELFLSGQRC